MSYKIFDNSLHLSGNESTLTRLSYILNLDMTDKIEDNIIPKEGILGDCEIS